MSTICSFTSSVCNRRHVWNRGQLGGDIASISGGTQRTRLLRPTRLTRLKTVSLVTSIPNKYDAFLDWCDSKGVVAPCLEIFEDASGYRGLRASEQIQTGEVIIRVPLEACLTGSSLQLSAPLDSSGKQRLFLRVLEELERPEASAWAPYLAVLPEDPVGVIGCSKADLEEIQDVLTKDITREWTGEIMGFFRAFQEKAREDLLERVEELTWRKAVGIAHSRGMFLEISENHRTREDLVIAPVADLLNHTASEQSNANWGWREEENALCVWAQQPIAAQEEAKISYGEELGNDSLFQYYGFVLPNNPHDTCQIFDDLQHVVKWYDRVGRGTGGLVVPGRLSALEFEEVVADVLEICKPLAFWYRASSLED
ncbi:hypothetical protein CYMTET_16226 [Cymbomonas tetramitiformis]|uniref:SET domain-containing protein n=1 Tax=Cymbomonas tetramitiformis TaxID=36881 RepID=A0AAE0GCJ5_9CHLO|nr:hypothetical protein CYMTET_16226 [Cymbomonas tetramitiformis]